MEISLKRILGLPAMLYLHGEGLEGEREFSGSLGQLGVCPLHFQGQSELISDLCLKNLTSEKKSTAEAAF